MKRLSDAEKITVVEKYLASGCNCSSLSQEFGVGWKAISGILKRRGIEVRQGTDAKLNQYSINDRYWEKIDTEEKAYFLGFMYADGCLNYLNNAISISLQARDIEILDKLNTALDSNRPIYLEKARRPNGQDMRILQYSNKKMYQDLVNLGCTPRKSLTLQFPTREQVPEDLLRHFIRGYFDGDGCAYFGFNKKGHAKFVASLVSTEDFCRELDIFVKREIGISSFTIRTFFKKDTPTRTWGASGGKNSRAFMAWLYKDAAIYLQRKYDKYTAAQQHIDDILEARKVDAFGERKTQEEWSEDPRCLVGYLTLSARLLEGWEPETAITTVLMDNSAEENKIEAFGEKKYLREWTRDPRCTVNMTSLKKRLNKGIPPEQAITNPKMSLGVKAQ